MLCASLTLKSVEKALVYEPNQDVLNVNGSKDLDGALPDFEALPDFDSSGNYTSVTHQIWQVIADLNFPIFCFMSIVKIKID